MKSSSDYTQRLSVAFTQSCRAINWRDDDDDDDDNYDVEQKSVVVDSNDYVWYHDT